MASLLAFLTATKSGRLLAVFLCAVAFFASLYALGGMHARQKDRASQAEQALTFEQERTRDDAALQSLSDYRLCLEYVRRSRRMRDGHACEALRGLHGEQP